MDSEQVKVCFQMFSVIQTFLIFRSSLYMSPIFVIFYWTFLLYAVYGVHRVIQTYMLTL